MTEGLLKKRPVSVLYFKQSSGNAMKRLGVRIRDQGAETILVWAHHFRGPEDLIPEARAVVIETGCPGAALIARCYQKFSHNVEIHYVDSDGNFVDVDNRENQPEADAPVPEPPKEVDPREAIANLRARRAKSGGGGEVRQPSDEQSPAGENSSEADPSE